MSSRIILPRVSQWPMSPSSVHFASPSSVSLGPRHMIWYWFSELCFILKFNWQNYYIPPTLSPNAVQFKVANWRMAVQNAPWYPKVSSQMSQRNRNTIAITGVMTSPGALDLQLCKVEEGQSESSHDSDFNEVALSTMPPNMWKFPWQAWNKMLCCSIDLIGLRGTFCIHIQWYIKYLVCFEKWKVNNNNSWVTMLSPSFILSAF